MSKEASHKVQQLNPRMSGRTRIFVVIMTAFGAVQLASGVVNWQWSHPKLFLLYLSVAAICSYFQVRSSRTGLAISVSLPVILLSILQLNLPEAVAVGCAAALAQNFWNTSSRFRLSQIVYSATTLATVIATANFAYQSLVPNWLHNSALRLFVASVALFFANTFPAAIAARLNQNERLGKVWKETYFWLFPYYLVAAAIANVLNAAANGLSFETALIVLPVLYVAYRYYSVQKSLLEEQKKHAGNIAALHLRAIESLALAVEAKDNLNTRGHLRRVQMYALGVGKDLGLSVEELDALHAGALLHDIGKLAVPEHILTKPGKLTPEEFAKMKVHPLVGAEIVEQVQFPYPVAPIVRAHHEKWDGSGYPFGLKGEDIPLGARILTAVDCLDALTSNREYRQALPLDEGMQQIVNEAGKSFDPKVVEVLKRRYRELDQQARVNPAEHTLLSTNTKIDNGKAPDAGLDLCALSGLAHGNKPPDFLSTISSAGREGKLFLELVQGVVSSLDLNEIFERLEDSLRPMLPFDAMVVFLRQGNVLVAQHAAGDNKDMLCSLETSIGEGLTGWVALNRQPVVNGNPMVDPGFRCEEDKALNAAVAVPLEGTSGVLGVMSLYRRTKDAFSRDNLRILMAAAPKIGTALENALKFREMETQAHSDSLTHLPDSHLMMKSLELELRHARRSGQSLAIVLIELSGLSSLSRTLGQPAAHQLLRSAAKAMKDSCRGCDHVARIGEDRFALILPGMRREDLTGKTAKLAAIVAQAERRVSTQPMINFTVGEALYPHDADEAKLLLTIAQRRAEQHSTTHTESILALNSRASAEDEEPSQIEMRSAPPA
jgi:diguanylate cyclase (GGDEF)-like protein/putative nucleotidyltransferase with HDIG domain